MVKIAIHKIIRLKYRLVTRYCNVAQTMLYHSAVTSSAGYCERRDKLKLLLTFHNCFRIHLNPAFFHKYILNKEIIFKYYDAYEFCF
jgi:hypothetical protein